MESTGRTSPLPVYYVDMELGDMTLQQYIREAYTQDNRVNYPGIPPENVFLVMLDIVGGLGFLHQRHMIHRDLKPANSKFSGDPPELKVVLLVQGGPRRKHRWKIADFGIATVGTSKRLIVTKYGRGTAYYSAPEILLAEGSTPTYTNKVDIWGLGSILYELWEGKRPFQTSFHVMQYFWNQSECPMLSRQRWMSFNFYRHPDERRVCESLWSAITLHFPANSSVVPNPPYSTVTTENYATTLNAFLALLLHREENRRPSIRQVGKLIPVNYLVSVVVGIYTLRSSHTASSMLENLTKNDPSPAHLMFLVDLQVVVCNKSGADKT